MGQISDGTTAGAVITDLCGALDRLRDAEFVRFTEADLLDCARLVERAARLMFAVQVRVAGELDIRRSSATFGCTSSAALLRQTLNISAPDARTRVNTARAVVPQDAISGGETPPRLPDLAAAVWAGEIGVEQTRTVVATMAKIPARVDDVTRRSCGELLVEQGKTSPPEPFAVLARVIAQTCDPDGRFDDTEPAEKVDLSLGVRNPATGMTGFRGHLDDLGVELLRQAIDGLAKEHPAVDGVRDPRSPAVRRGQALKEVFRRYLNHGDAPIHGGERPHVTLTMSLTDLTNGVGHGALAYGGPISAAQARMLACDATIIPAVLGSASEVLDIGRATRIWPAAIRRAITLRDKGCCWYSCDRPPAWCDIHHLVPWSEGGPTAYSGGAMVCGQHHHVLHQGEWRARLAPDGRIEIIPPVWVDPTQTPRRNTYHHLEDHLKPDRKIEAHREPDRTVDDHLEPDRKVDDHLEPDRNVDDHLEPGGKGGDHREPGGT